MAADLERAGRAANGGSNDELAARIRVARVKISLVIENRGIDESEARRATRAINDAADVCAALGRRIRF
jgi:hypothetical protein